MILNAEALKYIKGQSFDKGYHFKIKGDGAGRRDKTEYLLSLLEGKTVVHLGCADHIDCIDTKIRQNIWLHKIVTEHAKECVGLDINQEAVSYIRQKYKGRNFAENVYCADITSDFLSESNIRAEYLLLGEILEHIDNPCQFLKGIVEKYRGGNISKVIITVPNMYNIYTRMFAWLNVEEINSDHRYWFSPFTLWKIADRSGLQVTNMEFVSSPITKEINCINILKRLSRWLFEWKPLNRKHLVLVAEIRK